MAALLPSWELSTVVPSTYGGSGGSDKKTTNSHHQEPLTKHTERKLNHTVYLLTMSHPGAIQTRSMMKSDRTPSVLKDTSSVLSVEDDIFEHTTSTSMKSGDPMEALQQAMISMM